MLEQILKIGKTTELRHIRKAIKSPSQALRAFKYHYRRVSQRAFIEFLASKSRCSRSSIEEAYEDLRRNSGLWKEIQNNLRTYQDGYALQMTTEHPCLYLLVRLTKPNWIIETGVASGASSVYLLRALHDNNYGMLVSIDLPPDNLPKGKTVGWVVPESLKSRWRLHIGDSKNLLGPVLNEIGKIDNFIHDSLHTYEHMIWEFRTAWQYLCPGGFLLSHDVGVNEAFFDFMKEKDIPWKSYRVFNVLGAFQKPRSS